MTQIRTTPWKWIVQTGLWVGLVGLPLVLCLAVILLDAIGWFAIRGGVGVTLQVYGWPILLVGLVSYCLLVIFSAGLARWSGFARWWAAAGLGRVLVVGLGAYLLGSLLQMILPEAVIFPFGIHTTLFTMKPLYWWPLESVPLAGYTIYPPLDARFVLMPQSEACCFKLGALLATLLFYWRSLARSKTKQLESAKFI